MGGPEVVPDEVLVSDKSLRLLWLGVAMEGLMDEEGLGGGKPYFSFTVYSPTNIHSIYVPGTVLGVVVNKWKS